LRRPKHSIIEVVEPEEEEEEEISTSTQRATNYCGVQMKGKMVDLESGVTHLIQPENVVG
jgi:hypothetical protein